MTPDTTIYLVDVFLAVTVFQASSFECVLLLLCHIMDNLHHCFSVDIDSLHCSLSWLRER